MTFEEKLKIGYEKYLILPKANILDYKTNELYLNKWYISTGRSFHPPMPHRHYTFFEFVFYCNVNIELYDKFLKI